MSATSLPHERAEVVDGIRIVPIDPPTIRFDRLVRVGWQLCRAAARERADVYRRTITPEVNTFVARLLPTTTTLRVKVTRLRPRRWYLRRHFLRSATLTTYVPALRVTRVVPTTRLPFRS